MEDLLAWRGLDDDPGVRLPEGASLVEQLAAKPRAQRDPLAARLKAFTPNPLASWHWLAREAQRPPAGAWRIWLIMAGRGFGKTRAGAEWVRERAETDPRVRIALVAASLQEARAVMVEGESGLLAIAPRHEPIDWQPSLRRLTWKNGAQAFLYSAGEPESLRGPQHHFAWCDEIGKWQRGPEAWQNLEMGLRLGRQPRIVATTTPRPVPLVKMVAGAPGVHRTGGRTADNAAHLAASFVTGLTERYAGTLVGRQELDGELIAEIEGALWSRALIEGARVAKAPTLARVVIGVDPPAGVGGDACGIVVAGLGTDGAAYVLADASVVGATPDGWARAVAGAAEAWAADRVIVEVNNGGAMVGAVLRAADRALPIEAVHASVGKSARAEPVQALYAAGRVFHAGAFPELEDEMAGMMLGGGYEGPGRSPDRADALVWAMHALMLARRAAAPGIRMLG